MPGAVLLLGAGALAALKDGSLASHHNAPDAPVSIFCGLLAATAVCVTFIRGRGPGAIPLQPARVQHMPLTSTLCPSPLIDSRRYCAELTRRQARNFYYGLKLLPRAKRAAMFALYAYMRRVDDIADDEDGRSIARRAAELEGWRERTNAVLRGELPDCPDDELWPAFAEMVGHYSIPAFVFDEVVAGQCRDLHPVALQTFGEMRDYCYSVACVVGIASIHVWGFVGGPETEALAVERGVAFQITNILRDLREDADRGRTYLPREELDAFGVSPDALRGGGDGGRQFLELMRFQIDRAETSFRRSADLERCIERDSRPTLVAMTEIYHRLLKKIAAQPRRVLNERVSLSVLSKLRIGWRAVRATA